MIDQTKMLGPGMCLAFSLGAWECLGVPGQLVVCFRSLAPLLVAFVHGSMLTFLGDTSRFQIRRPFSLGLIPPLTMGLQGPFRLIW